jgi:adenosylmethionine-8-amino-7-oxononanoate aminotransferase
MQNAARLDHNHLWHPFTQQRDWVAEEPLMI